MSSCSRRLGCHSWGSSKVGLDSGQPAILADGIGARRRESLSGSSPRMPDTSTRPLRRTTMGMLREFKEFAIKGNVIDLAVGVIIGAAFGKIVDSLVGDLIMPLIGALIGKLDFSNLFLVLGPIPAGTATTLDALKKAGVPVFAYGSFLTIAVNFVLLAFIIFLMIKQINRLKREAPAAAAAPAAPPEEIVLLRQ